MLMMFPLSSDVEDSQVVCSAFSATNYLVTAPCLYHYKDDFKILPLLIGVIHEDITTINDGVFTSSWPA
jgi:hypothetical protein